MAEEYDFFLLTCASFKYLAVDISMVSRAVSQNCKSLEMRMTGTSFSSVSTETLQKNDARHGWPWSVRRFGGLEGTDKELVVHGAQQKSNLSSPIFAES